MATAALVCAGTGIVAGVAGAWRLADRRHGGHVLILVGAALTFAAAAWALLAGLIPALLRHI